MNRKIKHIYFKKQVDMRRLTQIKRPAECSQGFAAPISDRPFRASYRRTLARTYMPGRKAGLGVVTRAYTFIE